MILIFGSNATACVTNQKEARRHQSDIFSVAVSNIINDISPLTALISTEQLLVLILNHKDNVYEKNNIRKQMKITKTEERNKIGASIESLKLRKVTQDYN